MSEMTPAQFAALCRAQGARARSEVGRVVEKGALEVKNTARRTVASSHSNAGKRAAGAFINYDMLAATDAEIGYDKPAGSLGNFNEYGSVNNTPDNALGNALERESAQVERFVGEAVDRLWR